MAYKDGLVNTTFNRQMHIPVTNSLLMKELSISVKNIHKTFKLSKGKKLKALDGLSFNVNCGECFGLLGPNGAGKSTMMKILFGRSERDSNKDSKISVFGHDPIHSAQEIKFLTGIVPQEDNLDSELNVLQNLLVYSNFYNIPKKLALKKIDSLLEFMELSEYRTESSRSLSGGMKRRLVIARALLNTPRLLILDEPTTGLDPQVRHLIWNKLRELKKSGVTILLTTHYMEEAFQICENLIILNKGKSVLEGNPVSLIKEHIESYVVEIFEPEKINPIIHDSTSVRLEKSQNRHLLYSNELSALQGLTEGLPPGNFFLRQSNLEDLFLKTTGKELNG